MIPSGGIMTRMSTSHLAMDQLNFMNILTVAPRRELSPFGFS